MISDVCVDDAKCNFRKKVITDMAPTRYDRIGINYTQNRKADIRIVRSLDRLLNLPDGSTIADMGAGTGNYANALENSGYDLKAVEPSQEMRSQAKADAKVEWLCGTAEKIPLTDSSVDGVIVILALHHFSAPVEAAAEIQRICPRGPLVIFTIDPRQSEDFWFERYFPDIYRQDFRSFPPIEDVVDLFACTRKESCEIEKFPLPHDLTDLNMYSGWNRPELYLDPQARQSMSGFALASASSVDSGVGSLGHHLKSGKWDQQYGHLRKQKYFDAGFRFIKFYEN